MTENKSQPIPDDEIDLSSIAAKIIRGIRYPFTLLIVNSRITLLFILLGLLIAGSFRLLVPKVYYSTFIIKPNDRTEKIHLKILSDVYTMHKLKDLGSLARELKLKEGEVKSITEIEVNPLANVKHPMDSINATEITLGLADPDNFFIIQTAIISYIENNPYFAKIKRINSGYLKASTSEVERELTMLDSLKKLQLSEYNKIRIPEQNSLLLKDMLNPTAAYTLADARFQLKMEYQARQQFENNFELVKSVVQVEKAKWPPRFLTLAAACVSLALVVCFIYLFFRNFPRS